jgi:hypothetical protein
MEEPVIDFHPLGGSDAGVQVYWWGFAVALAWCSSVVAWQVIGRVWFGPLEVPVSPLAKSEVFWLFLDQPPACKHP